MVDTEYDLDALRERVEGEAVFISGPMSGCAHLNAPEFAKAHALLLEAGARAVLDPVCRWFDTDEPQDARTHEHWMRQSVRALASERGYGANTRPLWEVLLLLDGWSHSKGATLEAAVASACGVEVMELSEVQR